MDMFKAPVGSDELVGYGFNVARDFRLLTIHTVFTITRDVAMQVGPDIGQI